MGGPDDAQPLRQAPRMALLAAAPTPAERLRIAARWAHDSYERGLAQLENVVLSAAPADPRVAELARFMLDERYEDTRSLVLAILGDATLRSGIEVADMIDYIYAVESSPVYLLLTVQRGWTAEKDAEWLVHLVERMFLGNIAGPPG